MSISLRDQLAQLGFKPPVVEKNIAPARPASSSDRRPHEGGHHRNARPAANGADPRKRDSRPGSEPRGPQDGRPRVNQGSHANANPNPNPNPKANVVSPTRSDKRPMAKSARGAEMDLGKAFALRALQEKAERIAAEQAKQEAARLRREARAALAAFLKDKGLNDPAAELTRHFEYGGKIKRVHVNVEQLKALNAGELGVVQNEGRYLLVSAEALTEAERIFAHAIALKVDPNATAEEDPYADPQYQVPDDLVW